MTGVNILRTSIYFRGLALSLLLLGLMAVSPFDGSAKRSGDRGFEVDAANSATEYVLVGAGDIAGCGSQKDEETAALLDDIPGTVFTTGDNAYPDGTQAQFNNCYDPTWGRHKARTRPSPGNHDYHTSGASGYFNYFGAAAGNRGEGYYSYDLGDWHIIALNSECSEVGGCGPSSPQGQWLQADLQAHPSVCTLAYWHHPRFSSDSVHGNSSRGSDFWSLLYAAGADIVLNGHAHTYERFAPQDPDGVADPEGIREFVVGTGGASLYSAGTIKANSEVRNNDTHGVLKLTLHPDSYDWEFVPIAGKTFTDSGSARCVGAPPENTPPVADDDNYMTDEDHPLTVNATQGVLDNDTDADHDPLTAVLESGPNEGTLTLSDDGSFTYMPTQDFNGLDIFTYKANDGTSDSSIAAVTISVQPVNDPPAAVDDTYTTGEDETLNVAAPGMLGNDSDPEGDPMTATMESDVFNGSLTLYSDGSFDYTPNAEFNGIDTFTYRASDGEDVSNIATVTITVQGVNDPPTAHDGGYTTDEDVTLNIAAPGVLGNDNDPEEDPLTARLVNDVSNGLLSLNPDGSFSYTPDTDFNGTDDFTYVANDGKADSNIASVTITVQAVNDPPTAEDDAYNTDEDVTLNVAVFGVLGNDIDPEEDPLTANLVSDVSNGILSLNTDGSFSYTPAADFNGTDHFTYVANDGTSGSNIATVAITVNPVNDPPKASDDAFVTVRNKDLELAAPGVLGNDDDPDGDDLAAILVSEASNGTVNLYDDGSFIYSPDPGFTGTDTFAYKANDGVVDSNIATVTITVKMTNDPPVAGDNAYMTDEDIALSVTAPGVLEDDSDPDGDTLSAQLITGPNHGSLDFKTDGSFEYTPDPNFNGTDTFSYKASDGPAESDPATVTLTVQPINDIPEAGDDAYVVDEDTKLTISPPGVLANDTDVDGDPLAAILVNDVSSGSLSLNPDGSFDFTPDLDFNGTVSFTYTASDGIDISNTAAVTITVTAVNDAPIAAPNAYQIGEDKILTVATPGVLDNDFDPDGDPLTVTVVSEPSHGSLALDPDGSFAYTPHPDFNGFDRFTYQVDDGLAISNTTTVVILVQAKDEEGSERVYLPVVVDGR